MISKEWWRTYTLLVFFGFMLMTSIAFNLVEQRNYYADLYFNNPLGTEASMTCTIIADVNDMIYNEGFKIKELEISLPCTEAMQNNLIKQKEGVN